MTLREIKSKINNNIGKKVNIKCYLGRNKYEKYDVIIKDAYENIFIVQLIDNNIIKSFSYSDIITKTIKIDY